MQKWMFPWSPKSTKNDSSAKVFFEHVPSDKRPGDSFDVSIAGKIMSVMVPEGAVPGSLVRVQISSMKRINEFSPTAESDAIGDCHACGNSWESADGILTDGRHSRCCRDCGIRFAK